jgi:hypothetical protein
MNMHRAQGFVELSSIVDSSGKTVSFDKAERYGWITPQKVPSGWDLTPGHYPVGRNLFVDGGRQLLCFVWGGRSPMSDYACQKFGIGTGTRPAAVIDTALESPIAFSPGVFTKSVDAITFSVPYEARVEFTIGAGQANGYLVTEFGLFSGNDVLLARIVNAGINKTSDWAPAFTWRLRF